LRLVRTPAIRGNIDAQADQRERMLPNHFCSIEPSPLQQMEDEVVAFEHFLTVDEIGCWHFGWHSTPKKQPRQPHFGAAECS
jgi:hypothetical protein